MDSDPVNQPSVSENMKIKLAICSWEIRAAVVAGHIIVGQKKKGLQEFRKCLWLCIKGNVDLKCRVSYFFFLVISQIRHGNLALMVLNLSLCGHKVTIYKLECIT